MLDVKLFGIVKIHMHVLLKGRTKFCVKRKIRRQIHAIQCLETGGVFFMSSENIVGWVLVFI